MNIDLWQAVVAVVLAAAVAGFGCRWWYRRQVASVTLRLARLDAAHQSSARMMSQTRKQVEDLQRLVAEYRRKLSAADLARRREEVKAVVEPKVPPPSDLPPMRLPGGWADTLPM
ncbi:MAG: hypothetical protein ACJ8G7_14995 [Rhizobacter sp.]